MAVGNGGQNQPCDVFREHYSLNSASFGSTSGAPTDDWHWLSGIDTVPSRATRRSDTTAYPTQPAQDSWIARVRLNKTNMGGPT